MTKLMFANMELCVEQSNDDDVSSLSSFESNDDDSSMSSSEDEAVCARTQSQQRNHTAPDLTFLPNQGSRKQQSPSNEPRRNARWGEMEPPKTKLIRWATDSAITPIHIPDRHVADACSMRKIKSFEEDVPTPCLDRWNASQTNARAETSRGITIEEGGRWSSSIKLRRSSTSDNAPRNPRHSLNDLKRNAMWSSRTKSNRSSSPKSKGEVNARWASLSRSTFKEGQIGSVPKRGISRWDSCSSFKTANSASLVSIDQCSTRPTIPKRRRRNGAKKTRRSEESTEMNTRKEMTEQEPQDTVTTVSCSTTEVADEINERDEQDDQSVALEVEYEGEEIDTFHTSFRYAPTACVQCCETILEVANEDEGLDASKQVQGDSILRAPRRRMSMSTALVSDGSEVSMGIGNSSRRRGNDDPSSRCYSSRRVVSCESLQERLGPSKPCRRESFGNSVCSHSSKDASIASNECKYRNSHRTWVDPEKVRSHPLLDERHPLIQSPAQEMHGMLSKKSKENCQKPKCPAA